MSRSARDIAASHANQKSQPGSPGTPVRAMSQVAQFVSYSGIGFALGQPAYQIFRQRKSVAAIGQAAGVGERHPSYHLNLPHFCPDFRSDFTGASSHLAGREQPPLAGKNWLMGITLVTKKTAYEQADQRDYQKQRTVGWNADLSATAKYTPTKTPLPQRADAVAGDITQQLLREGPRSALQRAR